MTKKDNKIKLKRFFIVITIKLVITNICLKVVDTTTFKFVYSNFFQRVELNDTQILKIVAFRLFKGCEGKLYAN